MSRPISLTVAVTVQVIAAVVALIMGIDLMQSALELSKSGVAEQLEATLNAAGISDVAGALPIVGLFVAGVMVTAIAIVRIVVAWPYLWRGQAWARMVMTVLIVLNIVSGFAYLIQEYRFRSIAAIALDVVMLWLLFTKESNAFVRERSAARAQERASAAPVA